MIFNVNPCRQLLLAALWVLAVSTAAAQVSQGGQPIAWDDASFSSDYPVHTTAEVDLAELAAADAITDLVKTAAWRFGVEHAVTIAPETHGVWTEEAGIAVWRMGLHCPDALSVNANFSTFDRTTLRLFGWLHFGQQQGLERTCSRTSQRRDARCGATDACGPKRF